MYKIAGYCDRWSARAGEVVSFMVSSVNDAPFDLRFVRLLCADPNPNGPGYSELAMPTEIDGRKIGHERAAYLGSFGFVPALTLGSGAVRLSATIWPTTPGKGVQGLLSIEGHDWELTLGIGPGGGAAAVLERKDGSSTRVEVARPLRTRAWYDVEVALDPDGTLSVKQAPHRPHGDEGHAHAIGPALETEGAIRLYTGAMPPDGTGAPARHHYNGKIERPRIDRRLAGATDWSSVAHWDFSADIPTQVVPDRGTQSANMHLVNFPTRAMTGSNWTGDVHDWRLDPGQYGAIHFHDDDHGDMGWPASFALAIPAHWPTGFYAAHVRSATGEDMIPFFVRPAEPRADVVFLVPTFTYQVYGSHPKDGRGASIAERAAAWNALGELPDMNRQFGLSTYSRHSDGSGSSIVSMLRPMLDTRPRQVSLMDPAPGGSGTGRICADSYIEQWLNDQEWEHDILTDHDLHDEGHDAIASYRVLITGEHPEYLSQRMMEAIQTFIDRGGRLMYLGGNGFYWRAEPSQTHPHAIEVRRAENGIRAWETEPGESYHAFTHGYGGLWRRIGRSSHKLVGVGFSVQGVYSGMPYRFTNAIGDPRVAFMFDGVGAEPGAEFGTFSYMGGGAAGYELDSVNPRYGTPAHIVVVAKGVVIRPDYVWAHEDILAEAHPRPQEAWSCADMSFFETPGGGAVFSVSSMTFAGALPIEGQLRTLTTNVLARFLDPTPFDLPT